MTKLKLAAQPLEIFLFISQKMWKKNLFDVKREFYFLGLEKVNEILELLKKENYILQNESEYLTTDIGKKFFVEYHDFGNEYIFKNELDFAIISFLYQLDDYFLYKFFPASILRSVHATGKGLDVVFNLENYIGFESSTLKKYVETNSNKGCLLTTHGRKFYENHLSEKEKESYNENLGLKSLELSIKDLEAKIKDYEQEKELRIEANKISARSLNISKYALWIAGISLLAFIIQLIFFRK